MKFTVKQWLNIAESLSCLSDLHADGVYWATTEDAAVMDNFNRISEGLHNALAYGAVKQSLTKNDAGESLWHLNDGFLARISTYKECDACAFYDKKHNVHAFADARQPGGSWGNFCIDHFVAFGCKLGTGYGQILLTRHN